MSHGAARTDMTEAVSAQQHLVNTTEHCKVEFVPKAYTLTDLQCLSLLSTKIYPVEAQHVQEI